MFLHECAKLTPEGGAKSAFEGGAKFVRKDGAINFDISRINQYK